MDSSSQNATKDHYFRHLSPGRGGGVTVHLIKDKTKGVFESQKKVNRVHMKPLPRNPVHFFYSRPAPKSPVGMCMIFMHQSQLDKVGSMIYREDEDKKTTIMTARMNMTGVKIVKMTMKTTVVKMRVTRMMTWATKIMPGMRSSSSSSNEKKPD